MPKETPKQQEHAQPDREHWHGPVAEQEDTREIHFLRELVELGLAKEKIYTDPEGNDIYEVRELVRGPDGTAEGGRIIRMENETLLKKLLDKDERLRDMVQAYRLKESGRGITLDNRTAEVVELMEMPSPKNEGKDN